MNLGVAIRAARRAAGLTQLEVAIRAGTSQTAVAAYENGRKAPNSATLERLASAMGTVLRVDFALPAGDEQGERAPDAISEEELRSLWLHRAIAAKIQDDPERARAVARENIAIRRAADEPARAEAWRHAWEALLDGPLDLLLATLCSTSSRAAQLRQTAPFAGLLSPQERWSVYRSFTRAKGLCAPPEGATG